MHVRPIRTVMVGIIALLVLAIAAAAPAAAPSYGDWSAPVNVGAMSKALRFPGTA